MVFRCYRLEIYFFYLVICTHLARIMMLQYTRAMLVLAREITLPLLNVLYEIRLLKHTDQVKFVFVLDKMCHILHITLDQEI
jgi:hypothetical protein